ncbi:c-type cytochrome biogenesis protein CcmI [Alsobacter sp. SYSU BS001988]
MLVWIIMALMTGAAVFAVIGPLGRDRPATEASPEAATDAHFYRSQIADIERDAERGLIDPAEAETAKVEAARLLLAAARRGEGHAEPSPAQGRRRLASGLALVGVPLLSLGLYLGLGNPNIADQPLRDRVAKSGSELGLDQAVAKIEEHLAANPQDGRGFEVVGPVYMSRGRYDDAQRAFENAIRLLGESGERFEKLGEAQVASAEGVVTAAARQSVEKALSLDPKLVKARFYRALAFEQDGATEQALAIYGELASEAPPGSPVRIRLNEKISSLGGSPPDQPSGAAADAIASMPAGERQDAIRSMVAGLDARLAANGADVEGWLRLVRSYMVLGEPAKARDALARARAALAGDAPGLGRIEALGRELKIEGS